MSDRNRHAQGLNRRQALGAAAAGVITGALPMRAHATPPADRPDVIFIMADDMGFADLSCTGSHHIKTPHIDSLRTDGIFLRQGYANSAVCSPSRTALLTGCYQQRFRLGLEEPVAGPDPKLGLPKDQPTLATVFRAAGYHTALVGKWHLGDPPANGPLSHGYDDFFGVVEGAADYFLHRSIEDGKVNGIGLAQGNDPHTANGYLTDLFGDEAVKQITASRTKPLFLSLHFTAPHWPWEGREDAAITPTLTNIRHTNGGNLAKYAEMVEIMDQNVGRVLDALHAAGRDNAIIVFTSDNGGERFSETWPFVGVKGELLEGGIRVPVLVKAPGRIPPGSSSEQVAIGMDWLPTLYKLATGTPPPGTFDGMDLTPHLTTLAPPVPRTLFWRFKTSQQKAVRDGDWKYLALGGKEHLFNLAQDEHERADHKDDEPKRFADLKAKWAAWNAKMLPYPRSSYSEDTKTHYPDRY